MKIIAISGSPRKGNSEWMLNKLIEYLSQSGAEVELLLLRKMDIKRCTGCLKCEDRNGQCRLKDSMNEILPRLLAADAVVLATPVYFEMVSGLLKDFMDRTCPIWTKMTGKLLAGLAVAEEGIGQAVQNMKTYGSVCGMKWVGSVTILGKYPGEASKNTSLQPKIKRLANKIVR
jgi:multimeric flavodoxin WrbA